SFFSCPPTTSTSTLSLHDALPIYRAGQQQRQAGSDAHQQGDQHPAAAGGGEKGNQRSAVGGHAERVLMLAEVAPPWWRRWLAAASAGRPVGILLGIPGLTVRA